MRRRDRDRAQREDDMLAAFDDAVNEASTRGDFEALTRLLLVAEMQSEQAAQAHRKAARP